MNFEIEFLIFAVTLQFLRSLIEADSTYCAKFSKMKSRAVIFTRNIKAKKLKCLVRLDHNVEISNCFLGLMMR